MNILLIGAGGRECALGCSLLLSRAVESLTVTPANFGVVDPQGGGRLRLEHVKAGDIPGLVALADEIKPDLTVVGPEDPLVAGIVDALHAKGRRILGPAASAARLEGSKNFAKEFMRRWGIPTADFRHFDDFQQAFDYAGACNYPLVVKADGLAAGKGVRIAKSPEEAQEFIADYMVKDVFAGAGKRVVLEECLCGPEISFLCLFDGETAVAMPPASDYKRLLDGDGGPNTGGMGSICPTPYATPAIVAEFKENILARFVRGAKEGRFDYRGVIYFGAIATPDGLKVLEFNVRFGDPETQVILPLLKSDLADALAKCADGKLAEAEVEFTDEACVGVVLASKNYPVSSSPPATIHGLEKMSAFNAEPEPGRLPRVSVFFAGVSKGKAARTPREHEESALESKMTSDETDVLQATGGRVLNVVARAKDLSAARRLAYEAVTNIRFDGMQFRTDIGKIQ
jgi:phosphoribosylamine--glycine ligase